jgi:alpha-glucosidase
MHSESGDRGKEGGFWMKNVSFKTKGITSKLVVIFILLIGFTVIAVVRCDAECLGTTTSIDGQSGKYVITAANGSARIIAYEGGIIEVNIEAIGRPNADIKCQTYAGDTDSLKLGAAGFSTDGGLIFGGKEASIKAANENRIGKPFSLRFYSNENKPLAELKGVCWDESGKVTLTFGSSPDEHYYGLGEPLTPDDGLLSLDYKGRTRAVWNKHWAPADLPINYLYSTRGYGLFIDNYSKAEYNFTNEKQFTWEAAGGRLKFFVIDAKTSAASLSKFMLLTGRSPIPPLWTLGFMQSRYGYHNAEEVNAVMDTFRKKKIPADTIIFDIDWQGVGGMGNLEWNTATFPDPIEYNKKMEAEGFKAMVIVEPYAWTNTKYYMKARMDKLFCKDKKGLVKTFDLWGRPGALFDFCNSDTDKFWQETIKRLHETGIDGWWTDLNEPDVDFDDMYYAGKTSRDFVHNVQPVLMSKAIAASYEKNFPNERAFIFSRSGSAGDAKYGTAFWSGDLDSSFQHLENQIPVGLSAGLSGLQVWGTDMGGFKGHPSAELMVRWFQFGLFNPIYRAHGDHDPREPWAYGPEAEKYMSAAIRLRYRLLPHLYTVMYQMHITGLPPMRPLFLEFPNDKKSWGEVGEFFFGKSILSAPVLREGEITKRVYFPPGAWYDFKTDKVYKGPSEIKYPAPLDTLPLFIREGSVIAMGPVIQTTGELKRDKMEFQIYPSAQKYEYELYEDDGVTNGYKRGEFATTKVSVNPVDGGYEISVEPTKGAFVGLPKVRDWTLAVRGVATRTMAVKLNGKEVKKSAPAGSPSWKVSASKTVLEITVPKSKSGFKIQIIGK